WCSEAAFAVVIAAAALTEACCGPCRYCGQSGDAARAGAGRAAAMTSPSIEIEWRTREPPSPACPQAPPGYQIHEAVATNAGAGGRYPVKWYTWTSHCHETAVNSHLR